MKNIIVRNGASAKENNQIHFCHCSGALVVRNGTYPRNHPQKDVEIRVQRYLCKSPKCPWQSFSILPHSILPANRHTYGTLVRSYAMFKKRLTKTAIARMLEQLVREKGSFANLKLTPHKITFQCYNGLIIDQSDWNLKDIERYWPLKENHLNGFKWYRPATGIQTP